MSPARLSRLKAANPFPAWPCWSTSSTSGPGWPVAMARLASGWRRHHQVILSGSVVASRKPCRVAGSLPRTGQALSPPVVMSRTGVICLPPSPPRQP
jgi:hypothetical protein